MSQILQGDILILKAYCLSEIEIYLGNLVFVLLNLAIEKVRVVV